LFEMYRIGTSSKWGGAAVFLADRYKWAGKNRKGNVL